MPRALLLRQLPPAVQRRVRALHRRAPEIPVVRSKGRSNGATPQDLLWTDVTHRWPDACREYRLIPDRRFRGDIVFPNARLCVEVDGWQYHGRMLADFKRDRDRQNLLTIHGWRLLRIPAGNIHRDRAACCALIARALNYPPRSLTCLEP